jgi:hypothetical protein
MHEFDPVQARPSMQSKQVRVVVLHWLFDPMHLLPMQGSPA